MKKIIIAFCAYCLLSLNLIESFAFVKPNSLFSNNMVLQQGINVPVWGKANAGEVVTVSFEKQKIKTTAKENGKWLVMLAPLKAGGPFVMTIEGENKIEITNILVGEVWVCSGQSNMERELGLRKGQKPIDNWIEEASKANYPQIRQFFVKRNVSDTALEDVNSSWVVCDTATVKKFSAVGYFFGSELHKKYNVPVGLLFSAVGGTPAQNWTSREALEKDTSLLSFVTYHDAAMKTYPAELKKFKEDLPALNQKWAADSAISAINNKPIPRKPSPPKNPSDGAGGLFNAMIAPMIPYGIKGAIWYQGEANAGNAKLYQTLFPTMIKDWRNRWGLGNFPFLYVQIAPFQSMNPEIRESQFLTLKKLPNLAMAVTTDCGDSADIHPTNKRPVGERLFLAARALAYKEKIVFSGPLYQSDKIVKDAIEVTFESEGSGLYCKDAKLIGFTIAGEDKKFIEATAEIIGKNKLKVYSNLIKAPRYVRYGWAQVPHCNLYNKELIPASPFRTDMDK